MTHRSCYSCAYGEYHPALYGTLGPQPSPPEPGYWECALGGEAVQGIDLAPEECDCLHWELWPEEEEEKGTRL